MPERTVLLRVAARLARGRSVDWEEAERAAADDVERAEIRKLRIVAAMSIVNRSLVSGATEAELAASLSEAKDLAGSVDDPVPTAVGPVLAPGSRWGQLEILERIGGGSFGEVYRARDTRLDREVALKVYSHGTPDRDENALRDASPSSEPLRRAARSDAGAIREARLLARVRHPNVVMVHGADRIAGRVGIWTEFLRGQTLARIVEERGVLDAREVTLIGIDLCRALAAVHAAGVVHQDVKPTNVMRADGGRIVLMDFGLGREVETAGRRYSSRGLSGTPLFMAPEVLGGAPSDARSDLYSLGVVLFALVTGAVPVEASTLEALRAKHARGERREVRDLRPDLPAGFVQCLRRLLSPDPGSRCQTAGEAEQALYAAIETPAPAVPDAEAARFPGGTAASSSSRRGTAASRDRGPAVPHHLPAEIDAFVGREDDVADLARALTAGSRLVTLQGPGGMGKTRLAIRYGWSTLGDWPGGVWFCDLTEAKSRDGIASAVGDSLGVPLATGDAVQVLGHAIAGRGPCLLILDNFEQVVDQAAETVGLWLARAPEVRILVTSRERLKLAGEVVQVLDALPLARGVELFAERARRQRPIELDGPEAESVREVVRLLEGIPLAIELSAARLRVMTPAQMVDRIAERFRILASEGTGRHATLRAAIDGSWETLRDWEKSAFAQCSVFGGGFSLEAAEGVLDLSAWSEAPWIVDVIQSLVDKSLLRAWVPEGERGGPRPAMRFGMFVSLQEYAREKLGREGAVPSGGSGPHVVSAAERRHAEWFARFGEEGALDALDQRQGVERRQTLVPELENLVLACRRMIAAGSSTLAMEAFSAAWAILELRGPLSVAIALGEEVARGALAPPDRARLLTSIGRAKQLSGRMAAARTDLLAALALHRESPDRRDEGRVLANLATLALNEGRIDEALPELEHALDVLREAGDRRAEGATLGNLGLAHHEQGRLDSASEHLEAALRIHREIGNRRSEGVVLGNLGNLRTEQGRLAEARECLEAALAIHREVGNRRFEGIALGNLGTLCREQDRLEEAGAHYTAALAIHREVGARRFEGQALDNLAQLSLELGRGGEARSGFEAARAVHRESGNRRSEGAVLGRLARALLEEGRIDDAKDALTAAEALLSVPDYRIELARVLCVRAELQRRTDAMPLARATLAEIEALAAQDGPRPDRELQRQVARLQQVLSEG